MNEFYDIAPEGQEPINPLQLEYLGPKRHVATFSIPKRNDYGVRSYKSHTIKRDTVKEDYDKFFVNRIYKTNPPYDAEFLLKHHYDEFIKKNSHGHKLFLKHIKNVVLPLLEKNKQHKVYVDLVNEWLDENRESKLNEINNLDKNEIRHNVTSKY